MNKMFLREARCFAPVFSLLLLLTLAGLAVAQTSPRIESKHGHFEPISMPLMFEENLGQRPKGEFMAWAGGHKVLFDKHGMEIQLQGKNKSSQVSISFAGSKANPRFEPSERLITRTNYYTGNDPSHWYTGIANYSRLRLRGIYPGIDLAFYGNEGQLEHDFVVAPHADPTQIALRFSGNKKLYVTENGDLIVRMDAGEVRLRKPQAYQEIDGKRRSVSAGFKVSSRRVAAFKLGKYDPNYSLVIDPVLVFATYLNGTAVVGTAVTTDPAGNIYICGFTLDPSFNGSFVARFNGSAQKDDNGSKLAWMSFLAENNGSVLAKAVAVDSLPTPTVYIAGHTFDVADFPLHGMSYQTSSDAGFAGFAAGFDAGSGQLNYSTLFGGSNGAQGGQSASGIATDSEGLIYVAGSTGADLPVTPNSFQTTFAGNRAGFILKIDPTVSGSNALLYGTLITGQNSTDVIEPTAVAVQGVSPQIYVTGFARGSFPVRTQSGVQFQDTLAQSEDAFIAKINPALTTTADLIYSTLIGGTNDDVASALAVDASGNAAIAGSTSSAGLGTPGVFQQGFAGGTTDGFVAVFDTTGRRRAATYLGGGQEDQLQGIAFDSACNPLCNIHIAGFTSSTDLSSVGGFARISQSATTPRAGFIAKMSGDLTALTYLSYLNGSGAQDLFFGIALDPAGNDLVTGAFESSDAPTTASALQIIGGVPGSVYVAKFSSDPSHTVSLGLGIPAQKPQIGFSISPPFASTLTNTWRITNNGPDTAGPVVLNAPTPQSGGTAAVDSKTYSAPSFCTSNTGGVTCVIASLPSGQSIDIPISATVTNAINSAPTLDAIASLGVAQCDSSNCISSPTGNPSGPQTSDIGVVQFGLSISPVPGGSFQQVGVGEQFDLPFVVMNTGSVDLTHLSLTVNPSLLGGFQVSRVMVNSTATCDLVGGTGCSDIPLIPGGTNFIYTVEGSFPTLDTDPVTGLPFNFESRDVPASIGTFDTLPATAFPLSVLNTPAGLNVQIVPDTTPLIPGQAPLTVTFDKITTKGVTSLSIFRDFSPPIGGYRPGASGIVNRYNLRTNATTDPVMTSATVCINTPDKGGYLKPSRVRMFMITQPFLPPLPPVVVDITTSIIPSSATEILPDSFSENLANPTVLTTVCGRVSKFPSVQTVGFEVVEPEENSPAFIGSITTSPTAISGQSSIALTVQGETDPDINPCVLGSNAASCSDRSNLKTYIFGPFISSSAAGANCGNGCTFIDISNPSQAPSVTVTMANGGQICVVALDQTINPNPTQVLNGILQGANCAASTLVGAVTQAIQLPADPGGFGFTLSAQPSLQQVGVGDPVSIPITVFNIQQSVPLTNLKLSVNPNLLQGFHFTSATSSGNATCDPGGSGCSSIPSLAGGASFTYTLTGNYPALDNDPNTGLPLNTENRTIPAGLATISGLESPAATLKELNTHLGTNVQVTPDTALSPGHAAVTVTFAQVTGIGVTSLAPLGSKVATPGSGYRPGASGKALQYDLSTSATVSGATVCVNVPDAVGYIRPSRTRMFLLNNGADITFSISPSPATEILLTSFTGNFGNATPLTSVCGQISSFPSNSILSFAVFEPIDPQPITFIPSLVSQPVSTSKGGSAGQSSVTLTVGAENDPNVDPCTLGSNANAFCSDRLNLKTYIFGSFLSSPVPGANCSAGCSFIDISNSLQVPSTTVDVVNDQPICIVAFDQTINPDPKQILTVLNGHCPPLNPPPGGMLVQETPVNGPQSGDGAGPNSATVIAGQTAITTIAFTPTTGIPLFSCDSAPGGVNLASAGISCGLLGQSSVTETILLTVQTTGAGISANIPNPISPYPPAAVAFAALLLVPIALRRQWQLRIKMLIYTIPALLLLAALVIGCGGGSGGPGASTTGTPSGTYTIIVNSNTSGVTFDAGDGHGTKVNTYTFTLKVN